MRGLGLLCPDGDAVIAAVREAVDRAGQLQIELGQDRAVYAAAALWMANATGTTLTPVNCAQFVADGRATLAALNQSISNAGGAAVTPPADVGSINPFAGTSSTITTVAIAAAVIAGAWVLSPVLRALLPRRKPLSRYRRRSK